MGCTNSSSKGGTGVAHTRRGSSSSETDDGGYTDEYTEYEYTESSCVTGTDRCTVTSSSLSDLSGTHVPVSSASASMEPLEPHEAMDAVPNPLLVDTAERTKNKKKRAPAPAPAPADRAKEKGPTETGTASSHHQSAGVESCPMTKQGSWSFDESPPATGGRRDRQPVAKLILADTEEPTAGSTKEEHTGTVTPPPNSFRVSPTNPLGSNQKDRSNNNGGVFNEKHSPLVIGRSTSVTSYHSSAGGSVSREFDSCASTFADLSHFESEVSFASPDCMEWSHEELEEFDAIDKELEHRPPSPSLMSPEPDSPTWWQAAFDEYQAKLDRGAKLRGKLEDIRSQSRAELEGKMCQLSDAQLKKLQLWVDETLKEPPQLLPRTSCAPSLRNPESPVPTEDFDE